MGVDAAQTTALSTVWGCDAMVMGPDEGSIDVPMADGGTYPVLWMGKWTRLPIVGALETDGGCDRPLTPS